MKSDRIKWAYRIIRDDTGKPMSYGTCTLGQDGDAKAVAEAVAADNRSAHSYYRGGITVSVWTMGEDDYGRLPQRTGPVPGDAFTETYAGTG